ncbi:MAG: DUF4352 domain-containing protein [Chloroflexi bacterium]|nr:DUF4352 domain-containing protein [Chloroflexota bacterium]
MTVHSVTKRPTEDTSALPPKPMVFVSISLTLENITTDYLEHISLSYILVDTEGREASRDVMSSSQTILFTQSLGGGHKLTGSIGFKVNPEAKGLTLIYRPFVSQRRFTPIRVSLE